MSTTQEALNYMQVAALRIFGVRAYEYFLRNIKEFGW